jgi:hypothetical protein
MVTARPAGAQPVVDTGDLPLTVAEQSDFTRTATYDDVIEWIGAIQSLGAELYSMTTGWTTEGREMPLVIASRPLVTTPAEAHATGKPILYLQGNIHAGEVEGKDALLMLLRDLTLGEARPLLDHVILLVNPIFNADGNEKWGPVERNRRSQDGPELVGLRSNGMGLDLNRDYMKAESPEVRGTLSEILNRWRPDLFMDLHTTNGSYHGWDLTYSASQTPTAPPRPVAYSNDVLLPEIRRRVETRGHPIFDYGNFGRREMPPTTWRTFGWEPRYASNYMGLRSMISILSEAVSYRPFRTRVSATYWFVREIVDYTGSHAEEITSLTRKSAEEVVAWGRDPASAPALGVRFQIASQGKAMGTYEVVEQAAGGGQRGQRTGQIAETELEMFTGFEATHTRAFPAGYVVPVAYPEAVALLQRHGVAVERLEESWSGNVQAFRVDSLSVAQRPYQGHRLTQVYGDYVEAEREVPAGWYYVSCAQPLGALIFTLLEPEVADGLAAWNFFDRGLTGRGEVPVLKVMAAPNVARRRLDHLIRP